MATTIPFNAAPEQVGTKSRPSEFDLIKTYFQKNKLSRNDVILGIGDDAALLKYSLNQALVITTDTLIEGIHFPPATETQDLGYKALAVNLSDLAAMGAEPAWFTLNLSLPHAEQPWLENFSRGLFELAEQFKLQLVGGDTTRGALSLSITALGWVPPEGALLRSGAQVGDKIYVSGTLGDAGLGLAVCLGKKELDETARHFVLQKLNRPFPRIALGLALRGLASSAIDISDGLLADLQHLLESSQVGAKLYAEQLPLSPILKAALPREEALQLALSAGDDYELCFTVPATREKELEARLKEMALPCYCLGEIRAETGLEISGLSTMPPSPGYRHF